MPRPDSKPQHPRDLIDLALDGDAVEHYVSRAQRARA